jgi:DDE superfamily endonuclease
MTVDGTDFQIQEPIPFSSKWYSHKYKGPGIRYEVAVSIRGGDLVHTNGPFECGTWNDIKIFRNLLMGKLVRNEFVEADKGYRGQRDKIRLPGDWENLAEKEFKSRARARQETVNRRFKQFKILKSVYRHDLEKHQDVFRSIVVLTQLGIESGETLFVVDYY